MSTQKNKSVKFLMRQARQQKKQVRKLLALRLTSLAVLISSSALFPALSHAQQVNFQGFETATQEAPGVGVTPNSLNGGRIAEFLKARMTRTPAGAPVINSVEQRFRGMSDRFCDHWAGQNPLPVGGYQMDTPKLTTTTSISSLRIDPNPTDDSLIDVVAEVTLHSRVRVEGVLWYGFAGYISCLFQSTLLGEYLRWHNDWNMLERGGTANITAKIEMTLRRDQNGNTSYKSVSIPKVETPAIVGEQSYTDILRYFTPQSQLHGSAEHNLRAVNKRAERVTQERIAALAQDVAAKTEEYLSKNLVLMNEERPFRGYEIHGLNDVFGTVIQTVRLSDQSKVRHETVRRQTETTLATVNNRVPLPFPILPVDFGVDLNYTPVDRALIVQANLTDARGAGMDEVSFDATPQVFGHEMSLLHDGLAFEPLVNFALDQSFLTTYNDHRFLPPRPTTDRVHVKLLDQAPQNHAYPLTLKYEALPTFDANGERVTDGTVKAEYHALVTVDNDAQPFYVQVDIPVIDQMYRNRDEQGGLGQFDYDQPAATIFHKLMRPRINDIRVSIEGNAFHTILGEYQTLLVLKQLVPSLLQSLSAASFKETFVKDLSVGTTLDQAPMVAASLYPLDLVSNNGVVVDLNFPPILPKELFALDALGDNFVSRGAAQGVRFGFQETTLEPDATLTVTTDVGTGNAGKIITVKAVDGAGVPARLMVERTNSQIHGFISQAGTLPGMAESAASVYELLSRADETPPGARGMQLLAGNGERITFLSQGMDKEKNLALDPNCVRTAEVGATTNGFGATLGYAKNPTELPRLESINSQIQLNSNGILDFVPQARGECEEEPGPGRGTGSVIIRSGE